MVPVWCGVAAAPGIVFCWDVLICVCYVCCGGWLAIVWSLLRDDAMFHVAPFFLPLSFIGAIEIHCIKADNLMYVKFELVLREGSTETNFALLHCRL